MTTGGKQTGKLYYSIGEVASMFDLNSSAIRFYENEFDIIKPHRNKKGNRFFTPTDIEHLRQIIHLVKEKGHTLAQVKEMMKEHCREVKTERPSLQTSSVVMSEPEAWEAERLSEPDLTVREEVLQRLRRVRKLLEDMAERIV